MKTLLFLYNKYLIVLVIVVVVMGKWLKFNYHSNHLKDLESDENGATNIANLDYDIRDYVIHLRRFGPTNSRNTLN